MPVNAKAASSTCPESWSLDLASRTSFPGFAFSPSNIFDRSGNLEKYKSELGFNLAVTYRVEFSLDRKKWTTYEWPLVLPDKTTLIFGPQSFFYLYPGYLRGVARLEVKDCNSPRDFFTPEYDTARFIVKDNFSYEQVIGNIEDFKRTESLIKSIKEDINLNLVSYSKTGKIRQSYPTDDSLVYLTPAVPGCANFSGPFPGYWVAKGKDCDFFIFGRQATLDGKKFFWVDSEGNLISNASDLSKVNPVMFVVSRFVLKAPKNNLSITCVKKTLTRKVVGKNPKCPAGFTQKS